MDNIGNATSVLREEHHLIEKAILGLGWILKELQTGTVLDRRRVLEMTKLFKNYLERYQHVKEDFLLSPLLVVCARVYQSSIPSEKTEHTQHGNRRGLALGGHSTPVTNKMAEEGQCTRACLSACVSACVGL